MKTADAPENFTLAGLHLGYVRLKFTYRLFCREQHSASV